MSFSLQGRLLLINFFAASVATATAALVYVWVNDWCVALVLGLLLAALLSLALTALFSHKMQTQLTALETAMMTLNDGDYSVSIRQGGNDELGRIISLYNLGAEQLRSERQQLYQRELLLDTVIQKSPLSLFLVDQNQRVVYSNSEADEIVFQRNRVVGLPLTQALEFSLRPFSQLVVSGNNGLFPVVVDGEQQFYLLTKGEFVLHHQHHQLFMIKQLTREISRKEADIWRNVIRVVSHEINNTLAPIASLAHTGKRMLEKSRTEKLEEVFATIGERAEHLNQFLLDYIQLAKLPEPKCVAVDWTPFVKQLQTACVFQLIGNLPETHAQFDPALISLAIINLMKNAHESGSEPKDVTLEVKTETDWIIRVLDRGLGISESVMENILLPFFTTKKTGSGVGLPLAKEIAEAHGGSLALTLREGGGVCAQLRLPR